MALAIVPSKQYIKYEGDVDYWTDVAGMQIGDIISVKGSKYNDGVFTVSGFVQYSSDHYMSVVGRVLTDEVAFTLDTDGAYNNTTTINIVDSPDVRIGQKVEGTGMDTTVAALAAGTEGINVSQITLTDATTGGLVGSGETLTFTSSPDGAASGIVIKSRRTTGDKLVALGDGENNAIDVWSYNGISNPSSTDDGWLASEINTNLMSSSSEHVATSEFVFTFADGVLRVTDINAKNASIMKWYGYIQRNQFDHTKGLSFGGWYEHPSYLMVPSAIANPTSAQHTIGTDAHYEALNSKLTTGGSILNFAVQTDEVVTAITEDYIDFEFATAATSANFAFEVGQVYSVLSSSSEDPECLMVRRPSEGSGGTPQQIRVYRGYGNTTDAQIADNSGDIYKRGIAWNIGVTDHADDGEWGSNTYEFWQTFIYDGHQESLPKKFNNTYELTEDDKSLECTVYADRFYSGRISGGRIYIRESGSADDLSLFADIDIVQGARMTLESDYTAWTYRPAGTVAHTQKSGYWSGVSSSVGLKSRVQNLDTYSSINTYAHDKKFNSLGKEKETHVASAIAGRRLFVANVTLKEPGDSKKKYGDRIMYSEANKFDTFLPLNFIDVSLGDYGEYTALESFADRLLAFKHNLVHIINISSVDPIDYGLEETIQKMGVSYQHSVVKTEFGVAWANEAGCFLYDGRSVRNLTDGKLGVFESTNSSVPSWSDFAQGSGHLKDVMVGYDAISNQLLVMRSPKDLSDNSNRCFIYDFDSAGWSYNTNLFDDSYYYTNFATDWNNNLIVGTEASASTISIKKYLPHVRSNASQVLTTRDMDFGQPGLKKKIYKVILTYKAGSTSQANPMEYAVDGTQSWTDITTGTGTITTGAGDSDTLPVSTPWDVAVFKPASPITCQSLQLRINPPSTGSLEINDITVEYRFIRQGAVS